MAIYEVQAPDGATYEIEGPDNATSEEIISNAKRLLGDIQPKPAQPKGPDYQDPYAGFGNKVASFFGVQNRGVSQALAAPDVMKTLGSARETSDYVGNRTVRALQQARQEGNQEKIAKISEILRSQQGMDFDQERVLGGEKGIASGREVVGSLINTASLAGGPVAAAKIPGLKGATGSLLNMSGARGAIGKQLATQGAKFGATSSFGSALQDESKGAKEIVTDTLLGAGIGALTSVGAAKYIEGKQIKQLQKAAAKYDALLGTGKQEYKQVLQSNGKLKTLGQKLAEKGGAKMAGSVEAMKSQATSEVNRLNTQYKPLISSADKSGKLVDMTKVVEPLKAEALRQESLYGPNSYTTQLRNSADFLVKKYGAQVKPSVAQSLKVNYYKDLATKDFTKPIDQLAHDTALARTLASQLREQLDSVSPQLAALNTDEALHRGVIEAANDNLAQKMVVDGRYVLRQAVPLARGGQFFSSMAFGPGLIAGSAGAGSFVPGVGSAIGAGIGLTAAVANRMATSTPGVLARAAGDIAGSKVVGAATNLLPKLGSAIAGSTRK